METLELTAILAFAAAVLAVCCVIPFSGPSESDEPEAGASHVPPGLLDDQPSTLPSPSTPAAFGSPERE
jgi:hypothetical protein